ncbi:hypothetical protein H9L12_08315 [Sphingomonas rhizophila]|uniref:Uncharacterized protein n=1 Tax=Sphingomonas rhizophila TaxID=2071607 RepID=A0A7G9S910_9SPHN|nr:hypothetical protein [Sphingomonas rhizophila]QNN64335.1 hypothetical protein H9L12_08315 [Sphingomonas rhizophila]
MKQFYAATVALTICVSAMAEAFALQASSQVPLELTCMGGGVANKINVTTINSNSSASGSVGTVPVSGYGNSFSNVYSSRQQGFDSQVDVRLFAGDDRIRMPRTMLPAIRGGKDGWFKLKNVVASERTITASAAVNAFNNPKIYIDRTTGTISISGKAGDFSGQCTRAPTEAKPQF